jgi:mono/diheme cytochrome c family protein
MKRFFVLMAMVFITAVLALAGCEKKAEEEKAVEEKPGVAEQAVTEEKSYVTKRILYVRENGVPEDYKDKANPLEATEENIERGKELYRTHCSMCHGKEGLGDTPAGRSLSPPASNMALIMGMPEATDAYLFWTVSEGGLPIKTPMLPFKGTFSEEDRWKIILYERTLKGE